MVNTRYAKSLRKSLDIIQQCHFRLRGAAVTGSNLAIVKQGFSMLLCVSADFCVTPRHLVRWASSLNNIDIYDFIKFCDEVHQTMVTCECKYSYARFKAEHGKTFREQMIPFIDIIKGRCPETVLHNGAIWLKWLKKLPLDMPDLLDESIQAFIDTDNRIAEIDFDDDQHREIVRELNAILLGWLKGLDLSTVPARHGNGAVAERGVRTKSEKDRCLSIPRSIWYRACKWKKTDLDDIISLEDSYVPLVYRNDKTRDLARLTAVPKTYKAVRLICMEPTSYQYFQQGVMRRVYDYFRDNRELHSHIKLEDNRWNQRYARLGSINGNYATIDLSAASDSVSLDLVKRIFRGTPLLSWLLATRSKGVEMPDGSVFRMSKFAPMGSSLCFPVECLVFAAIVEYVKRHRDPDERGTHKYLVYGDDIICPSVWANDVMEVLELMGFKVNTEKSYLSGPFRESCGYEAWNGIDISPFYYRIPDITHGIEPKAWSALTAAYNRASVEGMRHLRSYLHDIITSSDLRGKGSKEVLRSNAKPGFVYSYTKSPYLQSPNPTNFESRSDRATKASLQQPAYLTLNVISTLSDEDVERTDEIRYAEKLREENYRPHEDYSEVLSIIQNGRDVVFRYASSIPRRCLKYSTTPLLYEDIIRV